MKPFKSFICNWTNCSLPENLKVPTDYVVACEYIIDL